MPGVPTHGPGCETTTWPTDCPTCGQPVFYFSCTCGSGVFFDALGPPWPIHRDDGDDSGDADTWPDWLLSVQLTVADDGSITAALPDLGVSIVRPGNAPPDTDTPPSNHRRRSKRPRRNRQRRPDPIVAVPPDRSATRTFTGTLNEIIPVIRLTALGYADDGPMAAAMARAILEHRWADRFGRITVYTPRQGTNQLESYTALIPANLISNPRISRGTRVAVKLTGLDVSDRRRDWYCDDFRVVE